MMTNANLDKELSNRTKKIIKIVSYVTLLIFSIYAIAFSSDLAGLLAIFAGIPLSIMAFSIKISKTHFNNNTIILSGPSNKRKTSTGIFSSFTLYFIGISLILAGLIGNFDDFRGPFIIAGIAITLFNLARKRGNGN